jgi:uncharacterized protein YigA (DUF484 family)
MRSVACLITLCLALGCGQGTKSKPGSAADEQRVQQFLSNLLDTLNAKDGLKQVESSLVGRLPVPEVSQLMARLRAVQGASSVQVVEVTRHGTKAFRAKAAFTGDRRSADIVFMLVSEDSGLRLVGVQ